jgi:hypothetical protein
MPDVPARVTLDMTREEAEWLAWSLGVTKIEALRQGAAPRDMDILYRIRAALALALGGGQN